MNEEQPISEQQPESKVAEAQQIEPRPPKPQSPDPRQRLKQLLAIPERSRTDAIWDEIVELEIQTGPGNRVQPQQANPGQRQEQVRKPGPGKSQNPSSEKRTGRRFFNNRNQKRGPGKP